MVFCLIGPNTPVTKNAFKCISKYQTSKEQFYVYIQICYVHTQSLVEEKNTFCELCKKDKKKVSEAILEHWELSFFSKVTKMSLFEEIFMCEHRMSRCFAP
jgi:hypothetical protein